MKAKDMKAAMAAVIEYLRIHKRLRRWLIGVAIAVAAYTLIGFLILPWIARPVFQSQLTNRLGRAVAIESVRFNPYSLVLEVEKLSIAEAGSTERFAGFELLRANLNLSSLFRPALVIEDLLIDKPFVRIERLADGLFNCSRLIERLAPAPPREPASEPAEPEAKTASPSLVVYNLRIQDVEFLFIDAPKHQRLTRDPSGQACLTAFQINDLKVGLEPLRIEVKSVGLGQFSVREKAGGDLIAGFAQFFMHGIVYDLGADRLTVGSAWLQEPVLNLIVEQSGGLNLVRILFAPLPPLPETAILPQIALHMGAMRFIDRSLGPHFVGHMKDIEIGLRDFSTLPGSRATFVVKADAGAQGAIEIEGAVKPNDRSLNPSFDLKVSGADFTTFSPYTLRYISHPVETGRLDLRAILAVSDRKISGEIKAVMSNLTLGDERESPDDIGIPVELLLALLRDGDNGLELEVPVSGDLDDPEFALGKIIWRAIFSGLKKVVTSPFVFLASLVGGGEDIDLIAMEPGRTQILADSTGKVDLLIKALKKRPGVRLGIAAITDPATDGEALARLPRKSLAAQTEQLRKLGAARVEAIRKALLADPGISPDRLFVRQAGPKEQKQASRVNNGVVINIQ